jgi:hypothetical protein
MRWKRSSAGKAVFLWAMKQDAEGRTVVEQLKV